MLFIASLRGCESIRRRPEGERPIQAHVAKDNAGSIRVLEKCGFHVTHEERGHANARGVELDELVLPARLNAPRGVVTHTTKVAS